MIPAILALLSAGRAAAAAEGVAAAVTAGARAGVSSYASNKAMDLLTTRREREPDQPANDTSANDNSPSPFNKRAAAGGSGRGGSGGGDDGGNKPPFVPVNRSSIMTNRLFAANDNTTNNDSVTINTLLPVVKSIDRSTMQMVLQMQELNDMIGDMMLKNGVEDFNLAEGKIESGKESKEESDKRKQYEKEKKQIKNGASGLLAGGLAFGLGSIIAGGDPKVTVDTPGGGYGAPPPTKKPEPKKPEDKPKRKPSMVDGMLKWLGYDTTKTDTNQSNFLPEPAGKGKGRFGEYTGKETGRERQFLQEVSNHEGAGYETVFGDDANLKNKQFTRPTKPLTEMTINEVIQYQKQLRKETKAAGYGISNGRVVGTSAVGKGQFVTGTLIETLKNMGHKESDFDKLKYTPSLQNEMILNNAKRKGFDVNNPDSLDQNMLGKEWESFAKKKRTPAEWDEFIARMRKSSTEVVKLKPNEQAKKPMVKPTQKQEDGVLDYISKGVNDIVKSATNYMTTKKGGELKKQSDMQSAKESKKSVVVVDASTTNNSSNTTKSGDKQAKRPTPKAKQQTTVEYWSKYFGL